MFFNNQSITQIENNLYYSNDLERIKNKIVTINNEKFSYYHLCKTPILFKNKYNINLFLLFDVNKTFSNFNYLLKIYYINNEDIIDCTKKYCIDFMCNKNNNNKHYDFKKSKLIYSLQKIDLDELIVDFPKLIQDLKLCYECNNIWNYQSNIRYIDNKKKYEVDKCDNCKIKKFIEINTLEVISKCTICLTDIYINDHIKTLCSHSFHINCLKEWEKSNNKCPLCRTILYNNTNIDFTFHN